MHIILKEEPVIYEIEGREFTPEEKIELDRIEGIGKPDNGVFGQIKAEL